ncbi:MAG: MarR family transcriptional regulator [Gammaproteobacteria bacterium]|nr:MarR family transcriptional regulator [Gammaproteobacteria bacterium]
MARNELAERSHNGYICCRKENMKSLIHHLLGQTRTAILAVLMLRPEDRLHVREIARLTGISPGTLHRELTALSALGLLTRVATGKQVFFSANRACPVFVELAGLLRKTAGLIDVIREALQPNLLKIQAAVVYGSVAAGSESNRSDVDVLIIGDLSFSAAVRSLANTRDLLGREINSSVMKRDEFIRKKAAKDAFVAAIWRSPKLWVIGTVDEFG